MLLNVDEIAEAAEHACRLAGVCPLVAVRTQSVEAARSLIATRRRWSRICTRHMRRRRELRQHALGDDCRRERPSNTRLAQSLRTTAAQEVTAGRVRSTVNDLTRFAAFRRRRRRLN